MATELFSTVLQKFINKSPITVMIQGLLEQLLNAEKLDQWFNKNRIIKDNGHTLIIFN